MQASSRSKNHKILLTTYGQIHVTIRVTLQRAAEPAEAEFFRFKKSSGESKFTFLGGKGGTSTIDFAVYLPLLSLSTSTSTASSLDSYTLSSSAHPFKLLTSYTPTIHLKSQYYYWATGSMGRYSEALEAINYGIL